MPDENSRSTDLTLGSEPNAMMAWGGQRNISRVGRDRAYGDFRYR